MIIDLLKGNIHNDCIYDVCITGGGPAGISLALELSDGGLKVCLVESGGKTNKIKNQKLNKVKNIGIHYKDLSIQRSRFLGGASNLWGGNCIPLDPFDFRKTSVREESWPFQYESLEKYIKKAEKLMDIDNFAFGRDIQEKINLPLKNGENDQFEWKVWKFCDFPFKFSLRFFERLESDKNITVILNANLVDVETADEKKYITAATFKTLTGKICKIKASDFVLACGGVENARLLLNFHERKSLNITAEARLLGKNFAEHPNATVGYLIGKNAKNVYANHAIKYLDGNRAVKAGLGIKIETREKFGLLNGIISIWPIPIESKTFSRARSLLQLLKNRELSFKTLFTAIMVMPSIPLLVPHIYKRFKGRPINVIHEINRFDVRLMSETYPNTESCVNLIDDLDTLGIKRASLNWQLSSKDRHSFIEIAKLAKNHFEKEEDVELVLHDWIFDETKDWTSYINTNGHYGHHMGTTKMGSSSLNSVVDQNSKVHSMDNLYIAGSSVFPTFGYANPTLTIVALSIKLAEFFKKNSSLN